jgi:hypothetical protein
VFSVAASDLADRGAMAAFFYRLARAVMGKDKARAVREETGWFEGRTRGEPESV